MFRIIYVFVAVHLALSHFVRIKSCWQISVVYLSFAYTICSVKVNLHILINILLRPRFIWSLFREGYVERYPSS